MRDDAVWTHSELVGIAMAKVILYSFGACSLFSENMMGNLCEICSSEVCSKLLHFYELCSVKSWMDKVLL